MLTTLRNGMKVKVKVFVDDPEPEKDLERTEAWKMETDFCDPT